MYFPDNPTDPEGSQSTKSLYMNKLAVPFPEFLTKYHIHFYLNMTCISQEIHIVNYIL